MGNRIVFQKLTPTDTVDMTVYEDAFEYIFENEDIRNVAIAGPYSAGKSSLLESYKVKHSDKKFLHISLAHFEEAQFQDATEDDENIESVLEGKILNQLIQQIKEENIPQTNFRIKRTVNNSRCLIYTVGIVLLVLCIFHLKNFATWSGWVNSLADSWVKNIFLKLTSPYSLIASGIVAMVLLGIGLFQLLKTQKNKNIFRKLSVQGNEIEIFGEDDSSCFDKYLNEVLYLFENSGMDVIVFEDLDRFGDNKIFERLREINILSNIRFQNRKGKKCGKSLRFFYLLRDDIFINKDRTKFFDFILPVVPVLDSSNAYNQIKKHFEEGGVFDKFDEKFLRGLSLYIDDMRILKNIYNEFMVYFYKLNTIELNANKMLAMITYKNIFPRDFTELQLNRGFVYELFSQKEMFIKQEKQACDKKIKNKEIQIDYTQKEKLESIEELDDIKMAKYGRISPYYGQRRNDDIESYNEWERKEYPLRKRAIEDKAQNRLSELEEELLSLKEEKRIIENMTLHEIITRNNIDEIFRISSENEIGEIIEYKEIKASEYFSLLKFLIRHGYIDETYSDYMTFFYENSLTKGDKMFLRSITDHMAKPFSYSLNNIPLVLSNLDISDFEQEEIMNFDLFEYLLQNEGRKDILLYFVKQLKKGLRYQFIDEFFETKCEREKLVLVINTQWPQFFIQVLSGSKMSLQHIRDYSILTLEYMDETELRDVNIQDCLTNYISNQPDYLAIENHNVTKICEALKILNVSFEQIDFQKSNKDLFNGVYQNSYYRINFNNICLMLEEEYHFQNIDDALQSCISSVFSQPGQPLCKYVQENMDLFLEVVLSIPIDKFSDSSKDAIMVINDSGISEEHKIAYIERLETLIDTLADIDETMYQTELIARMKVKCEAENILEYFGKLGLTDHLVEFINAGNAALNYSKADCELISTFWGKCVTCERLSLKKYEEILMSIAPVYSEFDIVGVPDDKMEILIENRIIPMTEDTLIFMRKNYQHMKMKYIECNLSDYLDVATGNNALAEEVKEIIVWEVPDDIKLKALAEIKEKISVVNHNYSNEVVVYILKNNLDVADKPVLFHKYDIFTLEIRNQILEIAKRDLASVISNIQTMNKKLVLDLLNNQDISIDDRANIFVLFMGELTSIECQHCFKLLNLSEFVKIFEQNKRPRIPINSVNQKLLAALKENGFIDSFVEDQDNKVFKQVRRSNRKALPCELL